MTYSAGGLIQATDYNGFVGPTSAGGTSVANLNDFWNVGSASSGWGQTVVTNPSAGNVVTATQWATLVTNLATSSSHTGVAITSRTAPVAGNTISILSALNTDLTNLTNFRGNAAASGTEVGTFSGTTSKTTNTGSGGSSWTITFTHTITFPSANQARYFWNAGGLVRIQYGKSSTGTDHDPDWNTLAGQCGSIFLSGRVNSAAQTIAGQVYTGTTRIGGSGGTQSVLATTTGWYNLTTSPSTIFQLNNITSPYEPERITTTATATSSTVLTLVTTWVDDGTSAPGASSNITGGTATNSPSTTITGTAPTTLVTYRPPSSTFLSDTWGTPTISASVA
jgi:hypothetical protein